MKILIVSDTHRRDGNLLEVIEKTAPFDMMIHLGDTEGSEAYFKDWIKNDLCVVHVVREIMISSPIRRRRRRFPLESTGRFCATAICTAFPWERRILKRKPGRGR